MERRTSIEQVLNSNMFLIYGGIFLIANWSFRFAYAEFDTSKVGYFAEIGGLIGIVSIGLALYDIAKSRNQ